MKNSTIFITAFLMLASCQRNEKPKAHHADHQVNVMMKAMDESMLAMHKVNLTGNPDYDFAAMMLPHHEGAIVMATELLKSNTASDSLRSFSQQVIKAQREELSELRAFLQSAKTDSITTATAFKSTLNASMKPMMEGMQKVELSGNLQDDFILLMIPHHQSAVEMAKAYLPFASDEKIKKLAEAIISAQEKEIAWLKRQ
jgi:uncharacterized protein (DUF305 family)